MLPFSVKGYMQKAFLYAVGAHLAAAISSSSSSFAADFGCFSGFAFPAKLSLVIRSIQLVFNWICLASLAVTASVVQPVRQKVSVAASEFADSQHKLLRISFNASWLC